MCTLDRNHAAFKARFSEHLINSTKLCELKKNLSMHRHAIYTKQATIQIYYLEDHKFYENIKKKH